MQKTQNSIESRWSMISARVSSLYYFYKYKKMKRKLFLKTIVLFISAVILVSLSLLLTQSTNSHTVNRIANTYRHAVKKFLEYGNIMFLTDFLTQPDFQVVVNSSGIIIAQPYDLWLNRPPSSIFDPVQQDVFEQLFSVTETGFLGHRKLMTPERSVQVFAVFHYKENKNDIYIFVEDRSFQDFSNILWGFVVFGIAGLQWLIATFMEGDAYAEAEFEPAGESSSGASKSGGTRRKTANTR